MPYRDDRHVKGMNANLIRNKLKNDDCRYCTD